MGRKRRLNEDQNTEEGLDEAQCKSSLVVICELFIFTWLMLSMLYTGIRSHVSCVASCSIGELSPRLISEHESMKAMCCFLEAVTELYCGGEADKVGYLVVCYKVRATSLESLINTSSPVGVCLTMRTRLVLTPRQPLPTLTFNHGIVLFSLPFFSKRKKKNLLIS